MRLLRQRYVYIYIVSASNGALGWQEKERARVVNVTLL